MQLFLNWYWYVFHLAWDRLWVFELTQLLLTVPKLEQDEKLFHTLIMQGRPWQLKFHTLLLLFSLLMETFSKYLCGKCHAKRNVKVWKGKKKEYRGRQQTNLINSIIWSLLFFICHHQMVNGTKFQDSILGITVMSCLSFYSVCLSVCQPVCQPDCLTVCLSVYISVSLSICFSLSPAPSNFLLTCISGCLCLSLLFFLPVSICLSVYLSVCLCLSVCPYLSACLHLSVCFCMFICLPRSVCRSVCQSVCLSVCLSVFRTFLPSNHT